MANGISFWGQILLAWCMIAVAMVLPGRLCLRLLRVALPPLENLVGTLLAGTGLLILIYWVLSLTQLQWLLGAIVFGSAAAELTCTLIARRRQTALSAARAGLAIAEPLRRYWPLGLLMLLGIALQTWFTFWTAWPTSQGMNLLAWHASDAAWHLFTIFRLAHGYPPELGGFRGVPLANYHMLSNLLWAAILRLAPAADAWQIYFRVAPVFYSGLITATVFLAAKAWSGKIRTGYLSVAFVLFSGNFTYLLPLLRGLGKYPGIWDSMFWLQSTFGLIFNPSVCLSLVFLFAGLWALILWLRERRLPYLVLTALFWGILPGIKVYPGVLMFLALLLVAGVRWVSARDRGPAYAWLAVLPVFLLTFLPPNLHSSSLLRFLPGYNLGTMLVDPARMALMSSLDFKMLYLHKPWLAALILLGPLVIFVVGNLGVRVLALPSLARALFSFRTADPILLFIMLVIAGGFAAPLLFVQTGIQWNIVQFAYFSVALASVPAADAFWRWAKNWTRWRRYAALALILLAGLPSLAQFCAVVRWNTVVSPKLLEALTWLRHTGQWQEGVLRPLPKCFRGDEGFALLTQYQEQGKVVTLKAWTEKAKNQLRQATHPAPAQTKSAVWEEQDCMMVAAATGKNTYLEQTTTATVLGQPVMARAQALRYFYEKASAVEARDFLEREHLTYIFLEPGMAFPFDAGAVPLTQVFANEAMKIYRFN